MTRDEWRKLQRSLDPRDLETVQRFAEKLALDHPFVFVCDGVASMSVDGPGLDEVARDLMGLLVELGGGVSAFSASPSEFAH